MAIACLALALGVPAPRAAARGADSGPLDVAFVADEAEAVLAILEKRGAGKAVAPEDWTRLFATEGYRRLEKRETSMKRPFERTDFEKFVLSDDLLARRAALAETLARWRRVDVTRAAARALAYLPAGTRIRARIYPVVKPRDNSFVFELTTDPAIFLYLDPAKSAEEFDNTLAHELHHVGTVAACPRDSEPADLARLPEGARAAASWVGAFGEGMAMLAAAGGPDVHPHAASKAEDRERWDRDVGNFDADLRRVERFLLDTAAGRLDAAKQREAAAEFYGVQAPWYTVGWKMAALVETTFGRDAVVGAVCEPRRLLALFNDAAARHNRATEAKLALWSPELLKALGIAAPAPAGG